jgi:hypothetical protein
MISELGGMDDGHPFSGEMNFNDLTPEDRRKVNKYYRVDDVEVDDSYSELDSELEDEDVYLGIPDDMPSYKTKWNMPSDEEDEYPEPKRMFNRNSERPFRPRPFNRD